MSLIYFVVDFGFMNSIRDAVTFKIATIGGASVAQSVEWPTSAQVMISQFVVLSPASGTVRTARSLQLASDFVPPSLSLPLPHSCSVSLSLSLFKFK